MHGVHPKRTLPQYAGLNVSVEGTTDTAVFRAYVEQVLVPTLVTGDIVVMDVESCLAGVGGAGTYKVASSRRRVTHTFGRTAASSSSTAKLLSATTTIGRSGSSDAPSTASGAPGQPACRAHGDGADSNSSMA
jgi:hypothetical protein